MDALLELQRNGVQNFLPLTITGYCRNSILQTREDDEVAFHSLYRDAKTGEIACNAAHN